MSERDLIIERLERKLAEKEKELRELRKVAGMNVEEIKREILESIKVDLEKIEILEARVAELNKTVESLLDEILYLKANLPKEETRPREIREIKDFDDDPERESKSECMAEDEIIVCD